MSVGALLLADARFPAGGHAHSGGLEPAATAGTVRDLASLEVFLRGRLRTAGLVAAGLAAAACARARDSPWAELDAEADARTPSPAQREASRRQGRALLRAARTAWPDARWLAELAATPGSAARTVNHGGPDHAATRTGPPGPEHRGGPHHAVVLGAAAAAAACTPAEAAHIAAYQSVAGPASAAVRLLALDPMRATAGLAGLAGDVNEVANRAAAHAEGPVADLPYPSAPALDMLAEVHIRAEVRLFES
jgi:urease accessory protein